VHGWLYLWARLGPFCLSMDLRSTRARKRWRPPPTLLQNDSPVTEPAARLSASRHCARTRQAPNRQHRRACGWRVQPSSASPVQCPSMGERWMVVRWLAAGETNGVFCGARRCRSIMCRWVGWERANGHSATARGGHSRLLDLGLPVFAGGAGLTSFGG
jgi:hypothetical protein